MKSLYVHIPFCDHICTYCDFCKVFYLADWADRYLEALSFEINDKKLSGNYSTIYIGGGTPSSLSYEQLERLLRILESLTEYVVEYTIEVNPESMNNKKLDLLVKYGINRLSIGIQSFNDDLLKTIHRCHTSLQAIELIDSAKARGIDDINVDLIYGLPNQKMRDVYQDLEIINDLDISHISVYSLILEEHTVLKLQDYRPLNDEEDALWYHQINKRLENMGFKHYEVSNYYKKKPSLHNLVYWHYQDYDGVGLSAHSLHLHCRYENTSRLTEYLKNNYLYKKILLDRDDELFEKLMMGLRLLEGININEINDLFNIDLAEKYKNVICKYERLEMLKIENGYLKTTSLGMDQLNTILIDFME